MNGTRATVENHSNDPCGVGVADGAEKLIRRIGQTGETASDGAEQHACSAAIRTLTDLVGPVVVARAVVPGPVKDELISGPSAKLEPLAMKGIADWIDQYRRFWEPSFERLDAYLKSLQSGDDDGSRH